MAKTQSKIITETVKPLYAVAGATEVAYEFARGYTIEAQKTAAGRLNDVQKSVSKIEREPKALQNQALSAVNARVAELQKAAGALPKRVQNEIDDTVTDLAKTYADLVDRGEKIVAAIRKDGVKAVAAVRTAPKQSSVVRRERAKIAADKPSNSSRPVKKSATKKSVAKKTPAKTTAKKATKTATTAKKTASTTAKKATPTRASATSASA